MCSCNVELGEIVVIENFLNEDGEQVGRHSFVVVSNENGIVEGLDYNLVLSLMSSFRGKSEEYKEKKLSYEWNIHIKPEECEMTSGNEEEGFIKGNQLHYFNLNEHDYESIGSVKISVWDRLQSILEKYDDELIQNYENIKRD